MAVSLNSGPVSQGADLRRVIRVRGPGDEIRLRGLRSEGACQLVGSRRRVTIR